jgi:hypothetical protein
MGDYSLSYFMNRIIDTPDDCQNWFFSPNGGCFPTLSLTYSDLGDAVAEELHLPFDCISLFNYFPVPPPATDAATPLRLHIPGALR